MKIAVLSSHTPSIFWFRMDMIKSFQAAGCEVIAIGNESESQWRERFAEYQVSYRQISVERNGTNPLRDFKALSSIRRVLKEEMPDKIFCYQAKTVIYGAIAAHFLGIHEVYALIAGVGSVFLGTGLKNKLVQWLLCSEYRFALRYCPKVFFQNKDDSAVFLNRHILSSDKIVYVNGSGVNISQFVPSDLPDQTVFLYIGRLIRDKGIGEYLEACRMIKQERPDIRCLLVGPYDTNPSALSKEELGRYIEDGVIEYFGEQRDVRPYLQQCSVYVLPSYREGTPKTVLEAMASGRAILTTDAPGCRETVKEGVNGYLVPVKDTNALAKRMLYLAENPELVRRFGQESRKIAEQKFDVRLVNQEIKNTLGIKRR